MALAHLLNLSYSKENSIKKEITKEDIKPIIPHLRDYIAFWREYPDLFVDFMATGGKERTKSTFTFYYYQRIFLRVSMRYKYCYAVYPRAYSKSFLSILVLMIRAILYPGAQLFCTAGGKEQAAQILSEKVNLICELIPAFNKEIKRGRGNEFSKESKDYCKYIFTSGSTIENLAASERSRGRRMHAGLIEECVGVDQKILQEVIIPTMNVSRRCLDGTTQDDEVLNQSQVFITTAGYKNTYSYEKLIQLMVRMVTRPKEAFIMGGTWRIPVIAGLQSKNFINSLRQDSTFNEASFAREYESQWSGTVDNAYFDGEKFARNRILQKPEYEYSGRSNQQAYYILSVDVGRKGCQTVITVLKVTPTSTGESVKNLVNIIDLEDMHFEEQSIQIKKMFYKYKAQRVVVDGNGLGLGLVDYLVKPQTEIDGTVWPDFGIYNDDEKYYRKYRTNSCEDDAVYIIKANAPINTEAHTIFKSQLESGKLKFLIDDITAKNKLKATKMGQAMTPEQVNEYLKPYVLTTILKDELLNLREENEGVNIILKQANKRIPKDKFSSLEYGLYYIKQEEDSRRRKKKKFNAKDWKFYN